jgi:hypothetical protein
VNRTDRPFPAVPDRPYERARSARKRFSAERVGCATSGSTFKSMSNLGSNPIGRARQDETGHSYVIVRVVDSLGSIPEKFMPSSV